MLSWIKISWFFTWTVSRVLFRDQLNKDGAGCDVTGQTTSESWPRPTPWTTRAKFSQMGLSGNFILLKKCLKIYLNFKSQISSRKVLVNRIKIFKSKKRRGKLYLEVLVFSNKHKLFDILKFNLKLFYQMIQSKGSLKLYLANLVRTKKKITISWKTWVVLVKRLKQSPLLFVLR